MSREHLQKASEIRRAAEQRIAAIRNNASQVSSEQSKQIMEIRAWANEQIETQKRLHARTQTEARTRLLRRIFGLGFAESVGEAEKAAIRTSYRDAIFRADATTTPEQAQLYLDRATAIGDALLAKALALIAFERGWYSVLAAYMETHESARDSLAELRALERAQRREQQFLETVAFNQIALTDEEQSAPPTVDWEEELAATKESSEFEQPPDPAST